MYLVDALQVVIFMKFVTRNMRIDVTRTQNGLSLSPLSENRK